MTLAQGRDNRHGVTARQPGRRNCPCSSDGCPTRAVQRLLEVVTVPLQGEHFLRRPLDQVEELGFTVERRDRFTLGLVERIAARR